MTVLESTSGRLDTSIVVAQLINGGYYTFYVSAIDTGGNESPLTTVDATPSALLVEIPTGIPTDFSLHQNCPNPFNPSTMVSFDLPFATNVQLMIYDTMGREVVRLKEDIGLAGYHQVLWDGRDAIGRPLPSGLYIALMRAGNFSASNKMLLLK
jgi:hypothetical protein